MLFLITTRCFEGCAHCLHDAGPNGKDMTRETLRDILAFLVGVQPLVIQISGGEPTLHPQFVDFVEETAAAYKNSFIVIESNGSFYNDATKLAQIKHVLRLANVHLQVRTHEKYYPNYKRIVNNPIITHLPKTSLWTDAVKIVPMGRARNMPPEKKWRTCVNTYLLAYQRPHLGLPQLISLLQLNKRYCSPMIDPQGYLHAGESVFCTSLGHVSNPLRILDTPPCRKCGLGGHLEVL